MQNYEVQNFQKYSLLPSCLPPYITENLAFHDPTIFIMNPLYIVF